MGRNHIKRLAAPKTWPIERKKNKWITAQNPGPHSLDRSLSLGVVLREILCYAKTTKEAKHILNTGKVKVDNIVRKDHKFALGLMDVLTLEGTKENFRMLLDTRRKLFLHKIDPKDAMLKPRKIIGKQKLDGNKTQITCYDGFNKNVGKEKYNVSDTLLFDIDKNEVKERLVLEKGSSIYITAGKKAGVVGVVKEIKNSDGIRPAMIVFNIKKEVFETLKDYAFVVGKTKPAISIPEK
tara:strand:- start:9596 stop:10309 length:714 start_codon:yes stop_codon:yes gene_type:complete